MTSAVKPKARKAISRSKNGTIPEHKEEQIKKNGKENFLGKLTNCCYEQLGAIIR